MTNALYEGSGSVGDVFVLEHDRVSQHLTAGVEVADDSAGIAGEIRREQRNAVVEESRTRAEDGLAFFTRRIRDSEARRKGERAAHGLAGESSSKVSGYVIAERPVVCDELFHIRDRRVQPSRAGELDLLGKTPVFAQQADRL